MSYADVGAALGISPGRVRQIEQRALAKLRRSFARRFGIVDFRGSDSKEAEHKFPHQRGEAILKSCLKTL
jgi:hypothetical protein